MELKIVKKKASSLKEIGHEIIEINNVSTLYELLAEVSRYEWTCQQNMHKQILQDDEIKNLLHLGKMTFHDKYNQEKGDFDKSLETMIQDYKDGLFRVFFNGIECLSLGEKLDIQEENEVVFIRLVMLAGRLW